MADGTNVGKIYLEIDLSQGLQQQIGKAADGISKGLQSGVENGFNLDNLLNDFANKFSSKAKEISNNINTYMDDIQAHSQGVINGIIDSLKNVQMPQINPAIAPSINPKVNIPKVSAGANLEAIKAQIDSLSASLEVTNRMIEQQQAKLAMLKEQYAMTFDETKKNKLEEQILKTEQRINKLIATSDAAGFKLADLGAQFQALNNGANEAAASVDNANRSLSRTSSEISRSSRSASAYDRTIRQLGLSHTMFGRILDRMLVRMVVFNLVIRQIENFTKFLGTALMANTAFSNSLAQVRSNLMVAFMPIYNSILPAINALMSALATATTYIASFISSLFGTTYAASAAAARGLNSSIDAMKNAEKQAGKTGSAVAGIGDAAKKAGGSLMGFDEINQLDMKEPKEAKVGGAGDLALNLPIVAPPIDVSPTTAAMEKVQKAAEKTREIIKTLLPVISGVVAGFLTFKLIESIVGIIDKVGGSFSGLWVLIAAHPIAALIIALAALAVGFGVAYATNKEFRDKVNTTWDSIKEKSSGTLNAIGGFVEKYRTQITIAGFAVATAMGPIGIAAYSAGLILQAAFEKVIPSVNLCKGAISSATKKAIGDFEELKMNTDEKLMALKATGETITKETAAVIIGNFNEMTKQIEAGFEQHKQKSISELQDLAHKRGFMTEQEYQEAVKKINQKYADEEKTTTEGNAKIQAILNNAAQQHRSLTQAEWDEINRIKETMQNQAIKALTKNQEEQRVIFENLKNQHSIISAQEAAEVVQNSKKTLDGVVKDANDQYNQVVEYAIHQRDDEGSITAEQAANIIDKAKKQKDETIKAAQEQHTKIIEEAKKQAGEHVDEIDWSTGQIKTKLQQFNEWWCNLSFPKKVLEIVQSIKQEVKKVFGKDEDETDKPKKYASGTDNAPGGLAWVGERGPELMYVPRHAAIIPNNKLPMFANGGLISQPTLAMIGEAKRKEAVLPLENQSVMQEIGATVANAMLSVMRFNGGGNSQSSDRPIEVVLNIDGTRFARAILPYTDKERDRIGTKAILKMV